VSNIETKLHTDLPSDVKSDVSSDHIETSVDIVSATSITVQIPQGLPLSDLHTEYRKNKRRGTDLNAYFVGRLIQQNLYKRKPINGFISMDSGALRDMFGGGYSKYIKALIKQNIVEEYSRPTTITLKDGTVWKHNGTYSKALGISKQYRLVVDENTPLDNYIIRDKQIVRKINDARIKKILFLLKNNPTARKVYDSLKKVSIDTDVAIQYIKNEYHFNEQIVWAKKFIGRPNHSAKTLKTFIREMLSVSNKKDKRALLIKNGLGVRSSKTILTKQQENERLDRLAVDVLKVVKSYAQFQSRYRWIKTITAIQDGNHSRIFMSHDKFSGRIYHTFTSTPRNIRPFMRLDGETLIEFDGANAQWQCFIKLCNILYKPSFYSKIIEDYGIINGKAPQQDTQESKQYLSMLHSFFDGKENQLEQELYKLNAYLSTNKLRQMVIDAELKRGVTMTDGEAKKALIANVLFGNVNQSRHHTYKSVQAFKKEFPLLLLIIKRLKTEWINESKYGYKQKDIYGRPLKYKAFPRLLQRMESDVFVKGMHDADCDFITLHDAIVTNESGAVEVKNKLEKIIAYDNSNIKLKYKVYEESV
jgi:tRNA nucleotidyltransferase/poly(A) polymerase